MKKYQITDEHRKELEKIKQKYIDNSRRTDAMSDYDKDQMRLAMRGLYKNANLPYVGDDKIIFVKSPLIAQYASAIAMSLIHNKAEQAAEQAADQAAWQADQAAWHAEQAVRQAVRQAADQAEQAAEQAVWQAADQAEQAAEQAVWQAVRQAADQAAWQADQAAWHAEQAVRQAVRQAADQAEQAADQAEQAVWQAAWQAEQAVWQAVRQAADQAAWQAEQVVDKAGTSLKISSLDIFVRALTAKAASYGQFCLHSTIVAWMYRSRSSCWPRLSVYGDFFKNVAKINSNWEKWDPINIDCLHGGVRFMTPDFTIISDRPERLLIDENGRLHCETSAAVRWRDGVEQYYWHGQSIPDWWITNKNELTPEIALTVENIEQRRAACEILGWANVLEHPSLKPRIIDVDEPHIGELIEVDLPNAPKERFLKVVCGTGRIFVLSISDKKYNTALEANAALGGWRHESKEDPMNFIPMFRT